MKTWVGISHWLCQRATSVHTAPRYFEGKNEKKTRHHRTAEKHCLKQIAWHKQHPHPRLSLMQPLGSRFHPNPSAQPLQLNHLTNSKQHISAWGTKPGAAPILPHLLTREIINHLVNEVMFMFQRCFSVGVGCLGSVQMSRRPPWC